MKEKNKLYTSKIGLYYMVKRTINFCPLLESYLTSNTKVLDLGCGPGGISVDIARRIQPGGTVVGIDLYDESVSYATEYAKASQVNNISFQTGDIQGPLEFADDSFDFTFCLNTIGLIKDIEERLKSGDV